MEESAISFYLSVLKLIADCEIVGDLGNYVNLQGLPVHQNLLEIVDLFQYHQHYAWQNTVVRIVVAADTGKIVSVVAIVVNITVV